MSKNHKIKKERENYTGIWLPEPIFQEEKQLDTSLDLDYGITVMLSRLNPKERAIFILKESFEYSYTELAETLELLPANCRKIYQRLKEKIKRPSTKHWLPNEDKKRIIKAFVHAAETGQLEHLVGILKKDIALYSDGGGKVSAATKVLYGLDVCSKFLWGIYSKFLQSPSFVVTTINNEAGFLIYTEGQLTSVCLIEVENGQVSQLYFIRNPDKIHLKE